MRMFARSARCAAKGPLFGLHDVPEVVVLDEEEPRVGGMAFAAPLARVGRVAETDAVPKRYPRWLRRSRHTGLQLG
jgi:hypothetical protein